MMSEEVRKAIIELWLRSGVMNVTVDVLRFEVEEEEILIRIPDIRTQISEVNEALDDLERTLR
jgi:hypothetical protein